MNVPYLWSEETPSQALTLALASSSLIGAAWADDEARPGEVVILALNAGDSFTRAARTHCADDPDPVDAYARRCVSRRLLPALRRLGAVRRWAAPTGEGFDASGTPLQRVDFLKLARRGGLGEPSRLGILLSPAYGLWWGMRFAAWVEVKPEARAGLEASPLWRGKARVSAAATQGPALASGCEGCDAPCLRACPALRSPWPLAPLSDASLGLPQVLPLNGCLAHVISGGCEGACAARSACPQGTAWAYSEEVHAHHHRAFLRMARGEG